MWLQGIVVSNNMSPFGKRGHIVSTCHLRYNSPILKHHNIQKIEAFLNVSRMIRDHNECGMVH